MLLWVLFEKIIVLERKSCSLNYSWFLQCEAHIVEIASTNVILKFNDAQPHGGKICHQIKRLERID